MNESGYSPALSSPKTSSATVADVSRRAGLSTATVSRVLNNSPLVREKTKARVLKAMRDLGYTANHSARALARKRTDTIGVIFPGIDSGFFTEVLVGVNRLAMERGLHLAVAFAHNTSEEAQMVSEYLYGGRVDALILMNLRIDDRFVREAANGPTPLVLIDRPVKDAKAVTVRMDNRAGAEQAMSHLLEQGFRRIAVIRGPKDTFDAGERWRGCQRAAARFGVDLDPELIWDGTFHDRSGYELMSSWLASGKPLPDALFALNDPMALGALQALNEHGHSVPADMALVGFDDIESARYLGLTTVKSPMRELGRSACQAVIGMLDGQARVPEERVLSTELVIRQSSQRPA